MRIMLMLLKLREFRGQSIRRHACSCRHGGGVLKNISDSLVAIVIPEGAHHLDFMFSHPLDPPSVLAARATQRHNMQRWIAQVAARQTVQTFATSF